MKKALALVSSLLLSQVIIAAPIHHNPAASGSAALHIDGTTQIPEGTLSAGDYTIRIVDHLSDRVIVAVSGPGGSDQKLLGVPTSDIPSSTAPGPVLVKGTNNSSALRGFVFAKNNIVEFVYPKNDAVALSKANGVKMLAMDPASEGLGAKSTSGISDDDRKIVTLWLLTPTSVGPGIEAARYHSDAVQPTQVAEAKKPAIARLPKTASELPLLWLAAVCSLGAAIGLTVRRKGTASI
jgi:hypothetical protein